MLHFAPVAEAPPADDTAAEAVARVPFSPRPATVSIDPPPLQRHGYQPSGSSRILGGIGTLSIVAAILVAALVTLAESERHKVAPTTLSVSLVPMADTPKPIPAKAEPQKPVEKQTPVQPVQVASVPPPIVPIPSAPQLAATVAPRPTIDPKPIEITPPAPPTAAAPPAPSHASHGPDRWEGRVLARLERFRRYPAEARNARQQGTVSVRFRVDRSGHILSSSMERSSGNPALDQAAMETLRSADPLPRIPADRADQIELVVPIEFTIAR